MFSVGPELECSLPGSCGSLRGRSPVLAGAAATSRLHSEDSTFKNALAVVEDSVPRHLLHEGPAPCCLLAGGLLQFFAM